MDEKELLAKAGEPLPLSKSGPAAERVLGEDDLSELYGLEMAASTATREAQGSASEKRKPVKLKRNKKAKRPAKKSGSRS